MLVFASLCLQVLITKSANQLVLDFFNSATTDELTIMNGCSRKKAEIVVGLRPFSDWNDLVRDNSFNLNFLF